jgi:3',5'-cyclic-AMP phosphodiesterase
MPMSLKIAVITDIHHGPISHTKAEGWQGLPVIERFVEHAVSSKADLMLDLGDHISDVNRDLDGKHMAEVVSILSRYDGPRYHLLGNHDVVNLSVEENEEIFGMSLASREVDLGDHRLILWQPGVKFSEETGFSPTGIHLEWLTDTLSSGHNPAIVATHVPVSGLSQVGNYYFENRPHLATYPDHKVIREAAEATGKVCLWLSGHIHRNTITAVRGIQYATIQSMSEHATTLPKAAESFADVEVGRSETHIRVYGRDSFEVRVPTTPSANRPHLAPMM